MQYEKKWIELGNRAIDILEKMMAMEEKRWEDISKPTEPSITLLKEMQDTFKKKPSLEEVKDWYDCLSLMVVEAGMNNDIWKDVLSKMKKIIDV